MTGVSVPGLTFSCLQHRAMRVRPVEFRHSTVPSPTHNPACEADSNSLHSKPKPCRGKVGGGREEFWGGGQGESYIKAYVSNCLLLRGYIVCFVCF